MPSARSAAASGRTAAPRVGGRSAPPRRRASAPQRVVVPRRLVGARVRWDRVGRVALLIVLAVVGALYLQHAVGYLSARSQYDSQRAVVLRLEHDNARLVGQEKQLQDPATIIQDARRLGMVKPGERPYVVLGAPSQ